MINKNGNVQKILENFKYILVLIMGKIKQFKEK